MQEDLIRQFAAGATAGTAADYVGVIRHTATLYFHKMRKFSAQKLNEKSRGSQQRLRSRKAIFSGSYKEKRGRGAAGKVTLFGVHKRGGEERVVIIQNARQNLPIPISRRTIAPDSVVHPDVFLSYNALDASGFRHHRINHSEKFVEAGNHINGIEKLWNQAKHF